VRRLERRIIDVGAGIATGEPHQQRPRLTAQLVNHALDLAVQSGVCKYVAGTMIEDGNGVLPWPTITAAIQAARGEQYRHQSAREVLLR